MLYKKLTAAVLSLLLGIAALGTMSAGAADLGDINGDGAANASDAARILIEVARIGSTGKGNFTSAQKAAGDVNSDGKVNASDASKLLIYSASVGAGAFAGTLQSYMSSYYTWNWKNGSCKLTLPPEWKGKYVISGNTVYCKTCYDATQGYGELLRGRNLYMHLLGPVLAILSFCLWEKRPMSFAMALTGMIPVILYGALYLYKVIYAPEEERWEDFYGFNRGGKWPVAFAMMTAGTLVVCVVLWLI